MKKELTKVALRHNALFLEGAVQENSGRSLNETTIVLLANCNKLGFTFSEALLLKVNTLSPAAKLEILEDLKLVTGVGKNWVPLVKQWDNPTGEGFLDHVFTFLANVFQSKKGTKLAVFGQLLVGKAGTHAKRRQVTHFSLFQIRFGCYNRLHGDTDIVIVL